MERHQLTTSSLSSSFHVVVDITVQTRNKRIASPLSATFTLRHVVMATESRAAAAAYWLMFSSRRLTDDSTTSDLEWLTWRATCRLKQLAVSTTLAIPITTQWMSLAAWPPLPAVELRN